MKIQGQIIYIYTYIYPAVRVNNQNLAIGTQNFCMSTYNNNIYDII